MPDDQYKCNSGVLCLISFLSIISHLAQGLVFAWVREDMEMWPALVDNKEFAMLGNNLHAFLRKVLVPTCALSGGFLRLSSPVPHSRDAFSGIHHLLKESGDGQGCEILRKDTH